MIQPARLEKPTSVSIVYMGDSITAGQYITPAQRWTDIISDRLHRQFLSTSVNLMILNRGVSGETTRQGLERFPSDVQQHTPDIMTLQFGLNDCNCWVTDRGLPRVTVAAYRANLTEMIDRARQFGASEIILSTNHPTLRRKTLLSGESLEDGRKRYNSVVREVAAETDVALCDIDTAFSGVSDEQLSTMLLDYPDQLHLSVDGHKRYAEAIQPYLQRAIDASLRKKYR